MTNRLVESESTYLRQHAHQNVHWFEWGDAAFAEAKRRDVPVLVSIGYAGCHWCHQMSSESFDDDATAELINENFVAIKVDRFQRPDVDAVFLAATGALTGTVGWPMTCFTTPEGEIFFSGTYFGPEAAPNRPSFGELLTALSAAWRERRDEVVASGAAIAAELLRLDAQTNAGQPDVTEALKRLSASFDVLNGGFGDAPKFPPAMVLDALLVRGDSPGIAMAQRTCEAMIRGGIHDQIGGGFHRYSVDSAWAVPHFEKMLSDNALLLGAFTRAWRRSADHDTGLREMLRRAIDGIVRFLTEELLLPGSVFGTSMAADSSDIRGLVAEGIYYLWNPELLDDALGETDGSWAAQVFHVTGPGTVSAGLSTLQLRGDPHPERLQRVSELLLAERRNRFAPAVDELAVASANGLAIDSLVNAAMTFAEVNWLILAEQVALAWWDRYQADPHNLRTLADHASLALAFCRLGGVLGREEWLHRAGDLLAMCRERFADDGLYYDADADPWLAYRPRDLSDNAVPAGVTLLVKALRAYSAMAGSDGPAREADQIAAAQAKVISEIPALAGWALEEALIDAEARAGLTRATVVVLVSDVTKIDRLSQAAWRMAPAGSAIIRLEAGSEHFARLGEGCERIDGLDTAYVCRSETCFEPVTDYAELREPLWRRGNGFAASPNEPHTEAGTEGGHCRDV